MNLAETRTHSPILNKPKEKKGRKPIKKVRPERAKANRLYSSLRKQFLFDHPICQCWLKENGIKESKMGDDVIYWIENVCWTYECLSFHKKAPRSTEIHHTKKPKCKYLNDTSTWLAVCREMHDKIEDNKNWAREMGYLQNN